MTVAAIDRPTVPIELARGRGGGGPASKRVVVAYGFWIFILSDMVMFSALFAAYAVLRGNTADGPTGAELFNLRCGGCHTLDSAATSGSKSKREIKGGERTNGPNFNVRAERNKQDVLFAIRNGGFSGAIMPANIVVGDDAQKVAEFLVRYSGKGGQASSPTSGQSGASSGSP